MTTTDLLSVIAVFCVRVSSSPPREGTRSRMDGRCACSLAARGRGLANPKGKEDHANTERGDANPPKLRPEESLIRRTCGSPVCESTGLTVEVPFGAPVSSSPPRERHHTVLKGRFLRRGGTTRGTRNKNKTPKSMAHITEGAQLTPTPKTMATKDHRSTGTKAA